MRKADAMQEMKTYAIVKKIRRGYERHQESDKEGQEDHKEGGDGDESEKGTEGSGDDGDSSGSESGKSDDGGKDDGENSRDDGDSADGSDEGDSTGAKGQDPSTDGDGEGELGQAGSEVGRSPGSLGKQGSTGNKGKVGMHGQIQAAGRSRQRAAYSATATAASATVDVGAPAVPPPPPSSHYKNIYTENRDNNTENNAFYTEIQEKKLLLKQMQLPSFRGEGDDVEKKAEVWVEAMDDYFIAAKTTPANQRMLGMFRLTGDAKLWWKQHCRDIGVAEDSQSWREIKQAVKEMYLPPAHEALKMNEFFALKQRGLSLEEYYSKFVSLRRYAPAMTIKQQVARFCQGLNEPISS
ncbi:hypothetical protein L7F22_028426 [Adiantum nelumboides]|nr:hypothetical protein [Adiantum nelumboides]